jgi:hypothetical protein
MRTSTPPARGQEEEQYQPGNERRDEGNQASDIYQCIDGYASHESSHASVGLSGHINAMGPAAGETVLGK